MQNPDRGKYWVFLKKGSEDAGQREGHMWRLEWRINCTTNLHSTLLSPWDTSQPETYHLFSHSFMHVFVSQTSTCSRWERVCIPGEGDLLNRWLVSEWAKLYTFPLFLTGHPIVYSNFHWILNFKLQMVNFAISNVWVKFEKKRENLELLS